MIFCLERLSIVYFSFIATLVVGLGMLNIQFGRRIVKLTKYLQSSIPQPTTYLELSFSFCSNNFQAPSFILVLTDIRTLNIQGLTHRTPPLHCLATPI